MKKKYIHFVGIKGTNMTPLALIAKEAGYKVSGSDISQEFITDAALKKAGITPVVGFSPEHITHPDLVITTGAHGGFDNIEVRTAKEKQIHVMSAGEATGAFMNGEILGRKFTGISIAGTHGKTTTSAMVATILADNKLEPSYIIGTGDVSSLGAPGHLGKGKYFVAEADEYMTDPQNDMRPRFLWQHPEIALFTNIEYDHPDVYKSVDDVRQAFVHFAKQISAKGVLIACGDDRQINLLLNEYDKKIVRYGFHQNNDYVLQRVHISGEQMFFWVIAFGTSLGEFRLRVTGEHNALNALAAVIAALEIGIPLEKIKSGLLAFQGSKRRLEFIGDLATGAKAYDDYAHHPTEIKKTLSALRQQYPKKRIICIFQPHTYSRTKELFDDFLRVFTDVDEVILTDVYPSLREEFDPTVSSQNMVKAMQEYQKNVIYLSKLSDVVQYVSEKRYRSDTILVSMGAGDVYTLHSQLKFL